MNFTNQVIDVYGFHDSLGALKAVPIASVATLAVDSEGREVILVIHEALYFGDRMNHTLLSVNQVRAYDVSVWDNPCDPNHSLSIEASDATVEMQVDGIVVYADTRSPTKEELQTLPRVELTSAASWNPLQASYQKQPLGVEYLDDGRTVSVVRDDSKLLSPTEFPFLSESDWTIPRVDMSHIPTVEPVLGYSDFTIGSVSTAYSMFLHDAVLELDNCDSDLTCFLRIGGFSTNTDSRKGKTVTWADQQPSVNEDEPVEEQMSRIEFRASQFPKDRHSRLTKEELMKKWRIGPKTAELTLRHTRQQGTRHASFPLARQYPTAHDHNRFSRLTGHWYADVMFPKCKSVHGDTCTLVMYNTEFVWPRPMQTQQELEDAGSQFATMVGMPEYLTTDGAATFIGRNSGWRKFFNRNGNGIKMDHSAPYKQRGNLAEQGVKLLKKRMHATMRAKGVHERLWNYCLHYEADIHNRLWNPKTGRTGWESVFGNTPDISEYLDFEFYSWVWFWEPGIKNASLGRWLGINHYCKEAMSSFVLKSNGQIVTCTTVQALTKDDLAIPAYVKLMEQHVRSSHKALDIKNAVLKQPDKVDVSRLLDVLDDDLAEFDLSCVDIDEADTHDVDTYNRLVGAQIEIHRAGETIKGRVKDRVRTESGNLLGRADPNPLLDTSRYVVEYYDGSTDVLSANVIAEAIYSQVDDEGRDFLLLDDIVDHERDDDEALTESNCWEVKKNGDKVMKRTTKGWKFRVRWKDGSHNWLPLKDLKESFPLQAIEYATGHQLLKEPAFAWWVPQFQSTKQRIISKLGTTKYWRIQEKLGIKVPKTIEQAYALDRENGNTLWQDAIAKEMRHVLPAFQDAQCTLEEIKARLKLVGYQKIRCHLVFDVKMDFTRKARFVAGGHMTDPPEFSTYSSVVSRETVRIAFLLAALNGLAICAADIGNAYLNADCKEKIYTVAGKEFGPQLEGKVLIVAKALYGLKSSGAAWRSHLSKSIAEMGFTSSRGDPDLYFRAANKPDGTPIYEYILVYVDDILAISHDTAPIMDDFAKLYRLKPGSIGPPERYLGADINVQSTDAGVECWAMSSDSYVRNALRIVEGYLKADGQAFKHKASCPFSSSNYKPELDDSPLLEPDMISRFQQLIGILRWACELGRLDILLEVSLLSAFNAAPRQGHLDQAYNIFSYLKLHQPQCILFDPSSPEILTDFVEFNEDAWEGIYPVDGELLPTDMPSPRGASVKMLCYVDASHASNRVTMRSHTGILIKLNGAPISWYSKRQNTVESSTFGSEFIALRIATEMCQSLRYKLRMFGVPIDGPTSVFCDNQSVTKNVSIPSSQLNKKHNAICYHKVRESVASGWLRVGWIESKENLADLFTKVLPAYTRNFLISRVLDKWWGYKKADKAG